MQLSIDDFAFDMRRSLDLLYVSFTVTRKNLTSVNEGTSFWLNGREHGVVSLPMPFNQQSGAIYLKSKAYLVVEISSDIVIEHCCHVCILSSTAGSVKSPQAPTCWPRTAIALETWEVSVVETLLDYDLTPTGQLGKWYEKMFFSIWFSCLTLTETHRC